MQHQLERKAVVNVRCTRCSLEQAPQRECRGCGVVLGEYFCAVCVLYDDKGAEKGLWHCEGCQICRAGFQQNFFHCDGCASCLSIALLPKPHGEGHKCSGGLKDNCPFCLEDMWSSRSVAVKLPCEHYCHADCKSDYLRSPTTTIPRCPMCSKTMINMDRRFKEMAREMAFTPMSAEIRAPRRILCVRQQ